MLQHNRSIHTLSLRFNKMSDRGAIALAQALPKNHGTLTDLNLHWNQIGKAGAETLAQSLAGV